MRTICFIGNNIKSGSSILRIHQIIEQFNDINVEFNIKIFHSKNMIDLKHIKESILIWITPIIHLHIKNIDPSNINILDIIDKYIYEKNNILLSAKFTKALIVNNNFMKKYFKEEYKYNHKIYIIYHHYDKRINIDNNFKNKLVFGYMGSIKSLQHSQNFLHYEKLKNKFNIEFYDTEIGDYVTNFVKKNDYSFKKPDIYNINNMPKLYKFNCHFNIRKEGTELSKFKTTAKIATAAGLGHNIITSRDEAVKDLMPDDYPFLLKNTDLKSVEEMINLVIKDYNGEKVLWNKGLQIMSEIKNKLNIKNIIKKYLIMFNEIKL